MASLQRINRHDRIDKKSRLVKRLAKLSVSLRSRMLAVLRERNISSDEAFSLLDTDRGGTIDKQEFYEGLHNIGVKVTDVELDGVW